MIFLDTFTQPAKPIIFLAVVDLDILKTLNWTFLWFLNERLIILTRLYAKIHLYFILNKKYGSFLKFWVPFQLCTTKSRLCGSSQSSRRNQISERSECIQISLKSDFFANFARKHRSEILSYGAGKELKISGIIHTFRLE